MYLCLLVMCLCVEVCWGVCMWVYKVIRCVRLQHSDIQNEVEGFLSLSDSLAVEEYVNKLCTDVVVR